MSRNHCRRWCLCLVVLFTSHLVLAEDAKDAWRVDFDDGNLDGVSNPVFVSGISKESEPDRLIFRSEQGAVTLGGQFEHKADFAELTWPQLQDLSLQKSPMLEMRVRLAAAHLDFYMKIEPTYVTASGKQEIVTLYATPQAEWKTFTWRLAGNDPLPKEWLPQVLTGLSIRVHSERPAELEVEIDTVRLRGFNATEQQREEEWQSLVRYGPPAEPALVQEFFPFGVYDISSDIGAHKTTHRHNFDVLVKHHLNYLQASFLGPVLEAAKQTGIYMSARVRGIVNAFGRGGTDAAIAYAKPMVDIIDDHPVVIGYDVGDERQPTDLWPVSAAVQILAQLDPTRFTSHCFVSEPFIRTYNPYLRLFLTDIYPLGRGRSPEYLYEWCHKLAKQTDNRRHWIILQSFGDTPFRRGGAHGGWVLPSVTELRLMTYGALAGGARGVVYYTFNWEGGETLADQWVNPRNTLLGEVARLGELLIPIGRRLLDAEVDFETVVTNDNEDRVIVGVLHAPKRDIHYLVVVNKDVNESQTANLSFPDAWRDQKVLNLASMEKSSGGLRVSLLPGDGNIYSIGSTEQCLAEADAIRANRIEESLRVMTPDLSTAERWELDVSQVLELQELAGKVVQQGGPLDAGEKHARNAGERLTDLMGNSEPYARVRSQLDRIGQHMGKVEPAMYEDHRDSKLVAMMAPFREPYWEIHARWAEAYAMLFEGKKEGLSSRVEALASDSQALLANVHHTLGGRSMIPRPGPDTSPIKKVSAFGATPPAKAHYVDGVHYRALVSRLRLVANLPTDGWLFKDDPEKIGVESGYYKLAYPNKDLTEIRIDRLWDGQGHAGLEEGWYRLHYQCPELPEGKRVFLHFGAVDECAWLYVDGKLIAWYDTVHPKLTWNQPFLLEVTGNLKTQREHLLAIRVGNTIGAGGIHKPVSLMVEK